MHGIQPTTLGRKILKNEGLLEKIEERSKSFSFKDSHSLSIADTSLDLYDLGENWDKVQEAIDNGELTKKLLGGDIKDIVVPIIHQAIFGYAMSMVQEHYYTNPVGDTNIWWDRDQDHKTWFMGRVGDFLLLDRANLSSRVCPWINLDHPNNEKRTRKICTDWRYWHSLVIPILDWANQIGQAKLAIEEIQKSYKFTDADRLTLEELEKKGYTNLSDLRYELETMFEEPLPTVKRGDEVSTDNRNYRHFIPGGGQCQGQIFIPYISERDGKKKLSFAVAVHPEMNKKMKRKRGQPLFINTSEGKKGREWWQHQTYDPSELPELLEGIKRGYDGWRGYLGQILNKFSQKYLGESILQTA